MDPILQLILTAIQNGEFNGEKYMWFTIDGVLYKGRLASFELSQKLMEERHPESFGDSIVQEQHLNKVVSENIDTLLSNKDIVDNWNKWMTFLDTKMYYDNKEFDFEVLRVDISKISAWCDAIKD